MQINWYLAEGIARCSVISCRLDIAGLQFPGTCHVWVALYFDFSSHFVTTNNYRIIFVQVDVHRKYGWD